MKRIGLTVSELPGDLLKAIFECLSLVDLVRAGAVSRTWYDASRLCLPFVNMGKPRTPWLMWWEENKGFKQPDDNISCYAKNFEENGRSYTIEGRWRDLGFDRDPQIVGCSNGWIVMLAWKTANPYLLNPFTKAQIQIPPIEGLDPSLIKRLKDNSYIGEIDRRYTFLYEVEDVDQGNSRRMRMVSVSRNVAEQVKPQVIVTVDKGNKVNGVFVRLNWSISYWRRRDNHCFSMKREKGSPKPWYIMLADNNQLYVLNSSWNVEIWGFYDGTFEKQREIINAGPYPGFPFLTESIIKYMVKIGKGEVLLAVRFFKLFGEPRDWWELYKMSVVANKGSAKWEKIEELDGYAVFLGHNEPMALLAEQVSGCRDNAIYYTRNHDVIYDEFRSYEDMGVMDLQSNSTEFLFKSPNVNAAVWIVPNLSK